MLKSRSSTDIFGMRTSLHVGLAGTFFSWVAVGSAQIEKPFEIEAELSVASKYVWRGLNLVNDWVSA